MTVEPFDMRESKVHPTQYLAFDRRADVWNTVIPRVDIELGSGQTIEETAQFTASLVFKNHDREASSI